MLIDEVVIDMVVHDGDTPPAGPGRPCLRIPRAGQARNPVPANNEEHVLPDVNLSWSPDPCLLGPLDYDVYFGTDSNMANNPKIASSIDPCTVDPCTGGDLDYGTVYYWRVDTNDANGASITRATNGTISVYKDNSDGSSFDATQVTTGVTDTEDFDSLTGIHTCCITTTDAWYETGHDYAVVLSAATIDGETVNAVLATFSIENRVVARNISSANLAKLEDILDGIFRICVFEF